MSGPRQPSPGCPVCKPAKRLAPQDEPTQPDSKDARIAELTLRKWLETFECIASEMSLADFAPDESPYAETLEAIVELKEALQERRYSATRKEPHSE